MSEKRIYVEGGGNGKDLQVRCRASFRKLLEKSGFEGKVPRIVACGSRNAAYSDFASALRSGRDDYVVLLVDSEEPVTDVEQPWTHLKERDEWPRPATATDEQVFLMTTCMETWIVADRASLREYYGTEMRENSLPPLAHLEQRDRHDVQKRLQAATKDCTNPYSKGKQSFEALAVVKPEALQSRLPSFARMIRILETRL